MSMNTPVANGDPTLAALIPEGVTLGHIISLFQTAYPVNGVQLLRARLGATHPANLAPPELAEFIKYMLAAIKSAGIETTAAATATLLTPNSVLRPRPRKTPSPGKSMTVACSAIAAKETSSSEDCPRGKKRNGSGPSGSLANS